MPKRFTTEAGRAPKHEDEAEDRALFEQMSQERGSKVDPSVRLGPLKGPASTGEVPMATTMRKPQAYRK